MMTTIIVIDIWLFCVRDLLYTSSCERFLSSINSDTVKDSQHIMKFYERVTME